MIEFEKKYGLNKSERLAYFQLGLSLAGANKPEMAIAAFENSLKSEGDSPLEWEIDYCRSICYKNLGDSFQAIKFYLASSSSGEIQELSLTINWLYEYVVSEDIAEMMIKKKKDLGLIKLEERASDHEKAELSVLWGKIFLLAKDSKNALRYLKIALRYLNTLPGNEADSDLSIKLHYFLGQVFFSMEDYPKAEENLIKALSHVQENANIYLELSLAYVKTLIALGKEEKAVKKLGDLKKLIKQPGRFDVDGLTQMAVCYLQIKQWDNAIRIAEEAGKIQGLDETLYLVKVESDLALHQYNDAVNTIDEAVLKYPFSDELSFLKIQVYIESQYDIVEGTRVFDDVYFSESKKDSIKEKLKQINASRGLDDNALYFISFIYCLMDEEYDLGGKEVKDIVLNTVTNQAQYPDIGNKILEALLNEKGNKEIAVTKYFEAGQKYFWLGDYNSSTHYFTSAYDLIDKEKISDNYALLFYLADSLRIKSQTAQPPFIDEKLNQRAYEIINQTKCETSQVVQRPEDNWFYLVAARIHADKFLFAKEKINDEYWRAILYAERALVHSKLNYIAWMDLGRYYNSLRLFNIGLECLNRSASLKKEDDIYVLQNLANSLVCLGRTGNTEAKEKISSLKAVNKTKDFYLQWDAYLLFLEGDFDNALKSMDEYSQQFDDDLWTLFVKLMSSLKCEYWERVLEVANQIRSLDPDKYPHKEYERAWAELVLGNIAKAIDLLHLSWKKVGNDYYESHALGQFYLFNNDLEKAEFYFRKYLDSEYNLQDLKFFEMEFGVLEKLAEKQSISNIAELKNTFNKKDNGWRSRIGAKIRELEERGANSKDEFDNYLGVYQDSKNGLPGIVKNLTEARQKWETGQTNEARNDYEKIPDEFPEKKVAIEKIYLEEKLRIKNELTKEFYDYITVLEKEKGNGQLSDEMLEDFQKRLDNVLEKAPDESGDAEIFERAILFLFRGRNFDLINQLSDGKKTSIRIKPVTWITIAVANLDLYELLKDTTYKEKMLVNCDEALKLIGDYGEALMHKIFLYSIDLLNFQDNKEIEKKSRAEIEKLFEFIAKQDVITSYEAIRAYDRNNKEDIYLFKYLQNLHKKFNGELKEVRHRSEKYMETQPVLSKVE